MKISAIIMAAGESSRMGKNKLALTYLGTPMLVRTLIFVQSLKLHEVLIITTQKNLEKIDLASHLQKRTQIILNSNPEKGQSETVKIGAQLVSGDALLYFTADQPHLDTHSIKKILEHGDSEHIIIPTWQNRPGSPVLFGKAFQAALSTLSDGVGGKQVIAKNPEACVYVEIMNSKLFTDIDTEKQYQELIR